MEENIVGNLAVGIGDNRADDLSEGFHYVEMGYFHCVAVASKSHYSYGALYPLTYFNPGLKAFATLFPYLNERTRRSTLTRPPIQAMRNHVQ